MPNGGTVVAATAGADWPGAGGTGAVGAFGAVGIGGVETGFAISATRGAGTGTGAEAGVAGAPRREPRAFAFFGGSTMQEKFICGTLLSFSGTIGGAVADETSRFTTGGGIGGQLPADAGFADPPEGESDGWGELAGGWLKCAGTRGGNTLVLK
jgi:hypothetical protein